MPTSSPLTQSPPVPLAYHREVVAYLQATERELWDWTSSAESRAGEAEEVRMAMLKSNYRLDAAAHPDLVQRCAAMSARLGVAAPATIYQAQGGLGMNAALVHLPGEAHLVFTGPILEKLAGTELDAVLAHELAHQLLWEMEGGAFLTADRLLYFKPSASSLNLTVASVPMVMNMASIRLEQLFVWHAALAAAVIEGSPMNLGRWLRFEDQPYLPSAFDKLIADARRDRAEFGFAQLRLAITFLHWHDLKETPQRSAAGGLPETRMPNMVGETERQTFSVQTEREAIAFIERHRTRSWFLYLAFNAVHTPMQASDDRLAKFPNVEEKKRRTCDAMTLAMDEAIGRVRRKIVEAGLEKNTLVLFISDHGGPTMPGTTVNASRNDPLRGSKRATLEGGVRVPFVLSRPGQVKPGVYDRPVIQIDAHATALAVAGVAPKPEWKLDGVNLLPFLSGEKTGAPHTALYWRFGEQMAIRAGDFKLVRYDKRADTLTGKNNQGVTPAKLYNLAFDSGETKDLAATMPDKVKTLQAKWDAWNKENVKPLWGSGAGDGGETGSASRRKQPQMNN